MMRESSHQSSAWQRLLGRIKQSFLSKKGASTRAPQKTAPKATSTTPQADPVPQHVPKLTSDSPGGHGHREAPSYEPVRVPVSAKNEEQDVTSKNPKLIRRSLSRKKRNPSDGADSLGGHPSAPIYSPVKVPVPDKNEEHQPSFMRRSLSRKKRPPSDVAATISNPEPYIPKHAGTDFSRLPNQPTQRPPGQSATESSDYQDFLSRSRIADRHAISGFINASATEAEALRVKTSTPANPYASEREQKLALLPEMPPFQVPPRPESGGGQGLSRSGSKRVAGKIVEKVGEYVKPPRKDSVSNLRKRREDGGGGGGGFRASGEDKRGERVSWSTGTRGSSPEREKRLTRELEPLSEIRDRSV